MNITFIGGGSLRILPIVRLLLQEPRILQDGEIRLYDIDQSKAEAVSEAIRKTPEFKNSSVSVCCPKQEQAAFEETDIVYITMGFRNRNSYSEAEKVCNELGFIASDNISPTGAFLSLIGGPIILNIARQMEKYCPNALMLIFANPVMVYSAMVNNHTKIKAFGLCGGHFNHRYDLPRLIANGAYDDGFDVNVAGINHMSFILSGTYQNQDLRSLLDEKLKRDWHPVIPPGSHPLLKLILYKMQWLYDNFGHIIFSSEIDGFSHIFYEEMFTACMESKKRDSTKLDKLYPQPWTISDFKKHLLMINESTDWKSPELDQKYFGVAVNDLAVMIMKAKAGFGRVKIAASTVNNGAVKGFTDRTVLEYSQWFGQDAISPVENLELPASLHALAAPLADFQTLLGDANAINDPKILAEAMWTYPIYHDSERAKNMFKKLLVIFKDDINPVFQHAIEYSQK